MSEVKNILKLGLESCLWFDVINKTKELIIGKTCLIQSFAMFFELRLGFLAGESLEKVFM